MPLSLTAHDLRWLAEEADGRRGETLHLIRDPRTGRLRFLGAGEKLAAGAKPVLAAATDDAVPGRAVPKVTCSVSGRAVSLAGADAVFWTEAAVEKFLWPYYHAHNLFDAPIQQLYRDYYAADSDIVAIAHWPPSKPTLVQDTARGVKVVVVEVGATATPGAAARLSVKTLKAHQASRRRPPRSGRKRR